MIQPYTTHEYPRRFHEYPSIAFDTLMTRSCQATQGLALLRGHGPYPSLSGADLGIAILVLVGCSGLASNISHNLEKIHLRGNLCSWSSCKESSLDYPGKGGKE